MHRHTCLPISAKQLEVHSTKMNHKALSGWAVPHRKSYLMRSNQNFSNGTINRNTMEKSKDLSSQQSDHQQLLRQLPFKVCYPLKPVFSFQPQVLPLGPTMAIFKLSVLSSGIHLWSLVTLSSTVRLVDFATEASAKGFTFKCKHKVPKSWL